MWCVSLEWWDDEASADSAGALEDDIHRPGYAVWASSVSKGNNREFGNPGNGVSPDWSPALEEREKQTAGNVSHAWDLEQRVNVLEEAGTSTIGDIGEVMTEVHRRWSLIRARWSLGIHDVLLERDTALSPSSLQKIKNGRIEGVRSRSTGNLESLVTRLSTEADGVSLIQVYCVSKINAVDVRDVSRCVMPPIYRECSPEIPMVGGNQVSDGGKRQPWGYLSRCQIISGWSR